MKRIYYRDFEFLARRRTYGKPVGVRRDGPMDVEGLVCHNRKSELWITEYLLEPEGRQIMAELKGTAALPPPENTKTSKEEEKDRVIGFCQHLVSSMEELGHGDSPITEMAEATIRLAQEAPEAMNFLLSPKGQKQVKAMLKGEEVEP